jgi:hypothetical protein
MGANAPIRSSSRINTGKSASLHQKTPRAHPHWLGCGTESFLKHRTLFPVPIPPSISFASNPLPGASPSPCARQNPAPNAAWETPRRSCSLSAEPTPARSSTSPKGQRRIIWILFLLDRRLGFLLHWLLFLGRLQQQPRDRRGPRRHSISSRAEPKGTCGCSSAMYPPLRKVQPEPFIRMHAHATSPPPRS